MQEQVQVQVQEESKRRARARARAGCRSEVQATYLYCVENGGRHSKKRQSKTEREGTGRRIGVSSEG